MKILMVSHHFNRVNDTVPIGGVQKHITCVTKELEKLGNKVIWMYPSDKKDYNEFDVVIFHDFHSYDFNCNIKNMIVFHGWEGRYPINEEIRKKRQIINERADFSINIGDFIEKLYDTKADLVIPGGVYKPSDKNYSVRMVDHCVWVGRIEKDNSPFSAFRFIDKMGWKCDVLGEGTLLKSFKSIYKTDRWNYYGFVDNPEDYIDRAEIVVAGGYLSILESVIRKKPVIGFYDDNPARRLYLENIPFKIQIFKDDTIAMLKYKKDEQDIIDKNYEKSLEYTWDKIAAKYMEGINQICKIK